MDDIVIKDRNTFIPQHELQANAWLGLRNSVRNRQTIMAMDYVVRVLDDLQAQVADLSTQIGELKSKPAASPSPKKITSSRPKKEDVNDGGTE